MLSLPRLLGRHLAKFLSKPRRHRSELPTSPPQLLQAALRKGDVLLVEGNSRFSTAIKYLSQSTWSHAALYIGDHLGPAADADAPTFCDVDINVGVRLVGLREFAGLHTRICRPVGLRAEEIATLVDYMVSRVGNSYDLKNIFDLARYLIRTPPLPSSVKRRFLELGSGEPTKAICSTLLAQAFGAIRYPILPGIGHAPMPDAQDAEILHNRHHSLYLPRDFDVSPYFDVVKPRLQAGFDFHRLVWQGDADEDAAERRRERQPAPQPVL
ncbi:YiiX/YebB-like N1pC/P60 family cysteine hydrolase [Xanthomonas sp. NCPPB 2654]|uniref:YiiX/YebB-like N1pC/P60 family cysteine hydrolase n=1 Tax=unclassified Xanthomonas TaxID=2643310 RepID=UPI0021E083F4|nr:MULTISPECIES: YiiX/YebB-like N1pC/P60 family cysteine hydrolase [unclassified Xanthomonas]MDL5365449.1 YiiX/YebB-like N1pC/P60 family cysteine hydrolase [Xanthomonas sp. NCPPB 2654]UYC20105.1 YiiX/YebB-like N1pC/P60 family cysteine hydrolase [Xanthomonas sp. CFBP 8443]